MESTWDWNEWTVKRLVFKFYSRRERLGWSNQTYFVDVFSTFFSFFVIASYVFGTVVTPTPYIWSPQPKMWSPQPDMWSLQLKMWSPQPDTVCGHYNQKCGHHNQTMRLSREYLVAPTNPVSSLFPTILDMSYSVFFTASSVKLSVDTKSNYSKLSTIEGKSFWIKSISAVGNYCRGLYNGPLKSCPLLSWECMGAGVMTFMAHSTNWCLVQPGFSVGLFSNMGSH